MAFFQKKPDVSSSAPLYTLGSHRTVLIIGLGNPGKEYTGTRHNIGFATLDHFAEQNNFPDWVDKGDLKCQVAAQNLGEARVILCKPTTFMNASGEAAQAIQHFYRLYNQQTLAVYDELAIKFGQIRTRVGGADAGHNGVKSLIAHLGDDFGRLRIGVSGELASRQDAANLVLAKFSKEEKTRLPAILKETSVLLIDYIFSGELTNQTLKVL